MSEHENQKSCCAHHTAHRDVKLNDAVVKRLNRVEGQVRGVKGMIEKGVYCDDILNQITAVRSALDGVSKLLLENHIKVCLTEQIRAGDDNSVEELIATIGRMLK